MLICCSTAKNRHQLASEISQTPSARLAEKFAETPQRR